MLRTSPLKFYGSLEVATCEDAIKSPSPPLATIKHELGEQALIALLTLMIADAVEFFNVGKSMTGEQIVQTSKLIFKDYFYLKPDDFKLCFDNAKRGKYGTMYDRMDGAVVFSWLEKYSESRLNKGEEMSMEKWNEEKKIDRSVAQMFRQRQDVEDREMHRIKVSEFQRQNSKPPEAPKDAA